MSHHEGSSIAELYRLLGRRMYGTAWRMLQNREEAEDAVQDAFLALHRATLALDPDESAAWLHRTLTNRCIDRLRHRGRWHEEALPDDLPPSGPRPLKAEWMDLERAVAKLPPRARLVFLLHDVEGFKHGEVAGLLEISEGASKSQLFRARDLLRRALVATPEAAS
jgi:RNA polymerase sigma-70 factor (ECF subfamily)